MQNSKINDIKIVSVVNNFEQYNSCITDNEFMNCFQTFVCDNTVNNLPIPIHYNNFIDNNIDENADFWVIFSHQDFSFLEKINEKILNLPKDSIYGICGVAYGFKPMNSWKDIKDVLKYPKSLFKKHRKLFGLGYNNFLEKYKEVETIDCCCIIVHSSLINQYKLRFDEKCDFHLYGEDFSMNAKINHNIKTKVVKLNFGHYGKGIVDDNFHKLYKYLCQKYNTEKILATPIN
jgi:hypothetical protein